MSVTVAEIDVADPPEAWSPAGFTVDPDAVCRVGLVRIRLVGGGNGITGWSLRGVAAATPLDGIPTTASEAAAPTSGLLPFWRGDHRGCRLAGHREHRSVNAGGITYVVADIDATANYLGNRTAPIKQAVQPGRRITTLNHRAFGMSVRTAMISAPILGG